MNALQVNSFSKKYGVKKVIDNVSFTVEENEVVGIIGHNGVGKTTLIETILGLRKKYEGEIKIFDRNIKSNTRKLKYQVGAQLQECVINKAMRVYECIQLQAAAFGVEVDVDQQLAVFDLSQKKKSRFSDLSGGQQQRLFILLSNIHDPKILFFDEITTGLDPEARRTVYKYILNLKKQGKTIILSTHIMEELNILCDRVIILARGKIAKDAAPASLVEELEYRYIATFHSNLSSAELNSLLSDFPEDMQLSKSDIADDQYELKITDIKVKEKLDDFIGKHSNSLSDLTIRETCMDDVFDEYCGKNRRN